MPEVFDRSFLPPAECELVVLSDTHYLLHPELQAGEWQTILEFPGRAERALRLAAALDAEVVVHLGDVTHEYPETGEAVRSREGAKAQFAALGLRPYVAPGNMDIGDKPDATSPAEWVTPETLAAWDAAFGRSWQSFDYGGVHGIVLNTCIMNGPLPEAEAQRRWLEADLAEHAGDQGKRIFVFLHHPVFFVDPGERATGMYNSLDDPARGWLLELFARYGVEMVFAGHTHFLAVNRVGSTRFFTAPSTTTSRAGLVEAFTVSPPDRGRSDLAKLGFFLVRTGVGTDGQPGRSGERRRDTRVHLIRTGIETPAMTASDPRRLVLTLTARDLPRSPIGVFASHPIGHMTPGPVIWPSVVRQRVRDDWRLQAWLEMGARRVRVPESDLEERTERERLAVLREEGVAVCAYWLWTARLDLPAAVARHRSALDEVELVLPGEEPPGAACLEQLTRLRELGVPVALSTARRTAPAGNQYHRRTRVGYDAAELSHLDAWLGRHETSVARAVVRLGARDSAWKATAELSALPLTRVGAIDLALDFPDQNEARHGALAAEAVFAAAGLPGARLWLGPLLDMDRSMDVYHGLLDRLSNPRPAFHVVRTLNTVLFAQPPASGYERVPDSSGQRVMALRGGGKQLWLCLPGDDGEWTELPELSALSPPPERGPVRCYHLADGTSEETAPTADAVLRALRRTTGPALLVTTTHEGSER